MGSKDRSLASRLDLYMEEQRRILEEQRRLHTEVIQASADARATSKSIEKAAEDTQKWILGIQRRVSKLEHWRTGLTVGGGIAFFLLKDKIMAALGLKVVS